MRIGPKHWRCVDIDAPGVPRGPAYGRVDWFAREGARHGFHLAWSWHRKVFGLYTMQGRKPIWQFRFERGDGSPEPLTPWWLWLFVELKNRHAMRDGEELVEMIERAENERAAEAYKQAVATVDDATPDVRRETQYDFGRTRPVTVVVPDKYMAGHGRPIEIARPAPLSARAVAERRARRRRKKRRKGLK